MHRRNVQALPSRGLSRGEADLIGDILHGSAAVRFGFRKRFSKSSPARNAEELVSFLKRHQRPGHLFRGQTREFPHNAPSAARSAMQAEGSTDRWVRLDIRNFKPSPRDFARYDLRVCMTYVWGPGIANLLAQQYGIASDGYDFTSDCEIAGFFASRGYPHYRPFVPADPKQLGVIYRVQIDDQEDLTIDDVNFTLRSYGYYDSSRKSWIYFAEPIFPEGAEKYAARHGIKTAKEKIDVLSDVLYARTLLLKSECALLPKTIERLKLEFMESKKISATAHMLQSTRSSRQKGGMYFPSYIHPSAIPIGFDLETISKGRFLAVPSTAVLESATKVQELRSFRQIDSFYFTHDSTHATASVTPDYLWPDRQNDWMMNYICRFAEMQFSDYLSSQLTCVDDFEKGLIDPGYLT